MRKVALTILFGVAVFISKGFLPTPIDKMLIAVQAIFLALGALLAKPLGATKVSVVSAVLTAVVKSALAPLTIIFAILYGLLTDALIHAFRVEQPSSNVKAWRLAFAMTTSTAVTGLLSYYFSSHVLGVIPRNPILEAVILVAGTISGLVGGYTAAIVWRKAIKNF
ncbi:MAG: hypothetical protein NZ932_01160 [Candidatus Bathyarchaeota archaeon]|nr:hypothetical protein [Candidatus Bathyarchaeota archaeon]MDW8041001.1 hypothetical protein [Nitrososphaerota archaeon]